MTDFCQTRKLLCFSLTKDLVNYGVVQTVWFKFKTPIDIVFLLAAFVIVVTLLQVHQSLILET